MSIAHKTTVHPETVPGSDTHHVFHDPHCSRSVSTTLVLSLSSLTGDEPTEMRPLNSAVDPDVLESHVRGRDRDARLSFEFHGHQVTVRDDGRITFAPLDEQETEFAEA